MGLLSEVFENPEEAARLIGLLPPPYDCFYCGGELGEPRAGAYWAGIDSVILLHGGCAVELGTHLVKDGMLTERHVPTWLRQYLDKRFGDRSPGRQVQEEGR
mgnify:CR=1 FL=1